MPRFLIFVAVVLIIIAGVHWYLWVRFVRETRLPAPWSKVAAAALALLALGMPLALVLARGPAGSTVAWPAFIWMGAMFLLFVGTVGVDLVRLAAALVRRARGDSNVVDPARRTALARLAASTLTVSAGGLTAVAVRAARGPIAVRPVDVALARLPARHDGFRLVQLTDVHVGTTIGRDFVADVVRRTNALEPDLIAITGDLVDGTPEQLRDGVEPLAELKARHGVYFVTGNHEYFSGVDAWLEALPALGVRVLSNERVSIGEGADAFDLAGVDDHSAARYGGLEPEAALAAALAGREPARELVLLAHQPRAFAGAALHGVGLQLSGHTHGGQIWPFGYLVHLAQPFVAGLHRRGASQIYVSRGTGYWGPPMRLGAPAEITLLTLRRA